MEEEEPSFGDDLNEAAGYMPYTLDLFDNSTNFRTQYKRFFEHVQALGRFTTEYLIRCLKEDEEYDKRWDDAEELGVDFTETPTTFLAAPHEQARLRHIFDAWSEAYIVCIESMREIRHYDLQKEAFGLAEDGHTRKVKNTIGMHVFCELTRLYGLIHRPAIQEEQDNIACIPLAELSCDNYAMMTSLARTKHSIWVSIVGTFDISSLYDAKEDPDEDVERELKKIRGMWEKPIMHYSQSELMTVIFFLTQQLNEIPTLPSSWFDSANGGKENKINVVEEYRKVFHVTWLRAGFLMQEVHEGNILDVSEMRQQQTPTLYSFNRDFSTFCTFYLGEITRRFFYYDMLIKNPMKIDPLTKDHMKELGSACFRWLSRVVDMFAEEAFEDLYHSVNSDGYQFVGDDGWFKYKFPQKIHNRGACITSFRPHLYKRFYSEAQLTKSAVLNSAKTGHVGRLFVFKAIDEHIKIQVPHVHWWNAVVVASADIEMSTYKLETNKAPVILQVFSSYWAYDRGRVYICDDIYEVIGLWFWLLATRYDSSLYECDLSDIIKSIVPKHLLNVDRLAARQQQQEERPMLQVSFNPNFEL
jgi:hypothetical protein